MKPSNYLEEVAEQSPRLARSGPLRAYLGMDVQRVFNLEEVVADTVIPRSIW
jgi:hypothetical protein